MALKCIHTLLILGTHVSRLPKPQELVTNVTGLRIETLVVYLPLGSVYRYGPVSIDYDSRAVTYIRVTRNANKIPILNSNNTVVYLTQVNEGNSISFIYTIGFYRCFGIHSVISLLFT